MNIALWVIQILLALLYLFSAGTKLILSTEQLRAMGSPNQILIYRACSLSSSAFVKRSVGWVLSCRDSFGLRHG